MKYVEEVMTRILGMCASHVDGPRRLRALGRALDSCGSQAVLVSLSYSGLSEDVVRGFVNEKTSNVQFRVRSTKMTQFQHYSLLCDEILLGYDDDNIWCVFFDDDDFQHPRRYEEYRRVVEAVDAEEDVVSVFPTCSQLNVCHPFAWEFDMEGLTSYEIERREVDAECGNNGRIGNGGQEYYMFAVRLKVLRDFCISFSHLLDHVYVDLVYRNVVRCLPCRLFVPETTTWMYAKTMVQIPNITDYSATDGYWKECMESMETSGYQNFDTRLSLKFEEP
jgi:hypothetical protein